MISQPPIPESRDPEERKELQTLGRRAFLSAAASLAAVTAMAPETFARNFDRYHPDAPPTRYPEPDVIPLDKRFKYKLGNAPIQRLYRGTHPISIGGTGPLSGPDCRTFQLGMSVFGGQVPALGDGNSQAPRNPN